MCLIARFQKLARNSSFSEGGPIWVKHNGTHVFSSFGIIKPDLDTSPSVMHQIFLSNHYLSIFQRTYSDRNGFIIVKDNQHFKVTASGPVDPDRVLMRIKAIDDNDRSKDITMELYHTGKKIHYFSSLYF